MELFVANAKGSGRSVEEWALRRVVGFASRCEGGRAQSLDPGDFVGFSVKYTPNF